MYIKKKNVVKIAQSLIRLAKVEMGFYFLLFVIVRKSK
jgi:hypothetical protein